VHWLLSSDGRPLNRNSAGHQWRQLRQAAGLDGYTLHDLRDFYASGLIAAGCDVVTVQRTLGGLAGPDKRLTCEFTLNQR
jgi:integrase